MNRVYVALGSNLEQPVQQIERAVQALQHHPDLTQFRISPWYRTAAIGGPDHQPDYINAACVFDTRLSADAVLKLLQSIEQDHGRVRDVRWGPRTLDLDLIWYENFTSDSRLLTVPHPRAHQRAFVLKPLIDLNAGFRLQGRALSDWLEVCSDQVMSPLNDSELDART